MALMFAVVVLIGFGPIVIQAGAETMNFKLVSMIEKVERVKVTRNRALFDFNAPLLILIGDKDYWTPANSCSMRMRPGQAGHEVILKIYPDATHGFDMEGMDMTFLGHRILYNPVATADAIIQVKEFFLKRLK